MSANELGREQSPYLLQHKDNPVHWQPWGREAFSRAAREDKPILLSVGYAACHWCHVMAHESFEDRETAELMNQRFINVKVDREERPDVDKIYMDALHRLGEQGGWPLTMFLRPDGVPFWGGTYFPPEPRFGRPSFRHVLAEIDRIWREERHKVDGNGRAILDALRRPPPAAAAAELNSAIFDRAARTLYDATDLKYGGLRGAPKFPQTSIYEFLWHRHLATGETAYGQAVKTTLLNLCQGGIYDHLAGGFARYSVDHLWLVPHFEKMLYDNALIVSLLCKVASADDEPLFRIRIDETLSWLLAEMRTDAGTFAASYDADSEGEEGRYYVWTYQQVAETLTSERGEAFCRIYDVTPEGNWEGKNILNRLKSPALLDNDTEQSLALSRRQLRAKRRERPPPGFDDKSLVDWNGLAITALTDAALLFDSHDWLAEAERSFASLLEHHWRHRQLHHSYRNHVLRTPATADGYANVVAAALNLHMATARSDYLDKARDILASAVDQLWDEEQGGFFFAPRQLPELIVRIRHAHDDATPNANAIMLNNLTRLYHLTGEDDYRRRAERLIAAFGAAAASNPFAHATFLSAAAAHLDPVQAVIIGSPEGSAERALLRAVTALPAARLVVQFIEPEKALPAHHPAKGKSQLGGRPTLYLCRGTRCAAPVTEPAQAHHAFASLA
ncbi:MAG: thioredoxin domain-containing protein [Aestuariivirgaceae bacterium]